MAKFEILPYCTVQKKRCIYSKTIQSLSYNIVLDIINNQFSFMELEIISSNSTIDLTPQLNEFISLFKDFKIQKAKINYRDFIINQNKSINYKKIK